MYQNISVAILSGGKSSRMGTNKSLLEINNKTVIEILKENLQLIFNEVILIANDSETYKFLKIPIYEDMYKGIGPLAGIHSALTNSKNDKVFVISCDIPLINIEIIKSIIEYKEGYQIIVPFADGFIQSLCGLYHKSLIPKINEIISSYQLDTEKSKQKLCKIKQLINMSNSLIIEDVDKLAGYSENIFLNMNHPEDYEKVKNILEISKSI